MWANQNWLWWYFNMNIYMSKFFHAIYIKGSRKLFVQITLLKRKFMTICLVDLKWLSHISFAYLSSCQCRQNKLQQDKKFRHQINLTQYKWQNPSHCGSCLVLTQADQVKMDEVLWMIFSNIFPCHYGSYVVLTHWGCDKMGTHHFTDNIIFKCIFLNENVWIPFKTEVCSYGSN